ncbi:hypothetical protein L208DRAFT_561288 [Tricholoma matsutake]|nr:hypothetical protein L208DRAFT_561288 [Tricholoma matsutake 945]
MLPEPLEHPQVPFHPSSSPQTPRKHIIPPLPVSHTPATLSAMSLTTANTPRSLSTPPFPSTHPSSHQNTQKRDVSPTPTSYTPAASLTMPSTPVDTIHCPCTPANHSAHKNVPLLYLQQTNTDGYKKKKKQHGNDYTNPWTLLFPHPAQEMVYITRPVPDPP